MDIPFHQHTGVDSPNILLKDCTGTPKADYLTASSNLKASSDAEKSGNKTTVTKLKEIEVYRAGNIKITFEGKYSGDPTDAYIYLNGVEVEQYTLDSLTYEEFTLSSINIGAGSKVQIYAVAGASDKYYYVQNFRIYWDLNYSDTDYVVNID